MSVEFDGTVEQRIDFGTNTNVYNCAQKSISLWAHFDSVTKATPPAYKYLCGLIDDSSGNDSWSFLMGYKANGDIGFQHSFSGSIGAWYTATGVVETTTPHHIVLTFDNTSASNDPVVYVDTVTKSTTEEQTPSGTAIVGVSSLFRVGAGAANPIDGKLQDVRVYNRILSANEILALYNSRCLRNVMNGLVFWAPMWGANAATFDGNTLSASETVVDWIGGAVGVPTGSPIGRGNTFQGN